MFIEQIWRVDVEPFFITNWGKICGASLHGGQLKFQVTGCVFIQQ